MRSGQYKIAHWKTSLDVDKLTSGGKFRSSCKDLPPLTGNSSKHKSPLSFNTALNSISFQGGKPLHHKSCENIRRTKDLNFYSNHKESSFVHIENNENKFEESNPEHSSTVGWEIGRVITVPIRNRMKGALSHSALNVLPGNDIVSYGSTSSGYSSSSSSYGSFKSCCSGSSSLPRITVGNHLLKYNKHESSFHNPLYDMTPSTLVSLKTESDASLIYDTIPMDNYLSISSEDPSEMSVSETSDEDPVARQCKEYFEKRLVTCNSFCKRWSMHSPDLVLEDSGVEEGNCSGMDSLESKNDCLDVKLSNEKISENKERTELDIKMNFLRQEMACLMDQDNALFKQLLALHDSITTLKPRNAFGHSHTIRPYTPSSSVDTEEDDEIKERIKKARTKKLSFRGVFDFGVISAPMGDVRKVDGDDEDEGHFTDLSFSQSPSHSTSPSSTISSYSSKDSSKRGAVLGTRVYDLPLENKLSGSFTRSRKSYAPTARNRKRSSSVHQTKPAPNIQYGATTALVLVHTSDVEVLFKGSNRWQNFDQPNLKSISEKAKLKSSASSQAGTFFNLDSISFRPQTNQSNKQLTFNSSCRQRSPKNGNKNNLNHTHPSYREALIM